LCDHGYEVWRSGSIREAANLVASGRRIAAVITALVFPDGNWRDLTDQVRARDPLLPVLLVTRAPTAELWWDAIEGGVSDILSPTFQPSDLEPSLRRLDHD
jgi:DNA-binding NtrC family response regulator